MEYETPKIMIVTDALTVVQGMKPNGVMEFVNPQNPIHSSAAYESDE